MDAVVVYESGWGNTKAIAKAVAEGLRERLRVEVFDVGDAPPAHQFDVEILVVGGPTHALGMSRPGTREDAARRGAQSVPAATGVPSSPGSYRNMPTDKEEP